MRVRNIFNKYCCLQHIVVLASDVPAYCPWDGTLLLTCDLNVDLQRPDIHATKRYSDILKTMSLQQLVSKPTRTTQHSSTLIDHIITNIPNQVTHTDVISSLMISDHDARYVCINVRITRFVPRYKFIRNEKNFNADAFIEDFERLPLSIVYSTEDPDMQVDLLSSLIRECIDRHAPLKHTKLTRPPTPWMKDLDKQITTSKRLSISSDFRPGK